MGKKGTVLLMYFSGCEGNWGLVDVFGLSKERVPTDALVLSRKHILIEP